jgi:hypothetical protein
MPEIRWFGALKVEVEEDTVHVVALGEVSIEQVAEYFKFIEEVQAQHGRLFVIADLAPARQIPDQRVRSMTAQWTAKNLVNGVAMYGIDPILRVFASLVFNAANLMRRGSAVVFFAKDEAAARQWVAQRRAALGKSP